LTDVRIDKWLWAARFFKSRSLATRACELGRIKVAGHAAKPSREVRPGDLLHVTVERGVFELEVVALSEVRGPAAQAMGLYQETPESEALRRQRAEERKLLGPLDLLSEGRPSKKDRRDINRLRGRTG
jgi:ribosome-associated heat shock protein Hsp15